MPASGCAKRQTYSCAAALAMARIEQNFAGANPLVGGNHMQRPDPQDQWWQIKFARALQLPHDFATPATLQEQQQYYASRNPNQNLYRCAIHMSVSLLSKVARAVRCCISSPTN